MNLKTITATQYIKENRKWFSSNFKYNKNDFELINDDYAFITTSLHPSVQGTTLDILFSWFLNKKILIDKYNVSSILFKELSSDINVILKNKYFINSLNLSELSTLVHMAISSAYLTIYYRSNMWNQKMNTNFWFHINSINNKKDIQNIKEWKTLIKRIWTRTTIVKQNTFIDNPIFDNFITKNLFLKADGDYFYNNTLVEIKSSKNKNIQRIYINQLIIYKILNSKNKEKLNIKYFEIFNPLWNNVWKIDINSIKRVNGIKLK